MPATAYQEPIQERTTGRTGLLLNDRTRPTAVVLFDDSTEPVVVTWKEIA